MQFQGTCPAVYCRRKSERAMTLTVLSRNKEILCLQHAKKQNQVHYNWKVLRNKEREVTRMKVSDNG